MTTWKENLYDHVPWVVKEWLVAAEAVRRNSYRRYGNYEAEKQVHDLTNYQDLYPSESRSVQLQSLQALFLHARTHSPFYRDRLPKHIDSLECLRHVPILEKADIRNFPSAILAQNSNKKELWQGSTSGSTGTPLTFFVGREGIRARFAIQDNYYSMYGCSYGERRVRLGGVKIKPVSVKEPPFWIFNRPDNQLQMSAYHLDKTTFPHYIKKLNDFRPHYITGYTHALYLIAQYLCENQKLDFRLQALFTDSEGAPPEYYQVIEKGFQAPCHDVYGMGETGWMAIQCPNHKYHVLELSCILEVVDDGGNPLPYGEIGRLVVTDLTQQAFPFIRYDTGDLGTLSVEACDCGWNTSILKSIEGRSDDYVITPQGRKVGRLSHVTKPGRGIVESQIVQTDIDRIMIRVVPTNQFDKQSMEDVLKVGHQLLGDEMQIDWEIVQSIPRTSKSKFKHVIREVKEPLPNVVT